MYIQLTEDYNADDNKGLYVHAINFHKCTCRDDKKHCNCDLEEFIALIRVENGFLAWYESQNSEYMFNHDDPRQRIGNGEYMTEENIQLICTWLSRQFPGCEIDKSELKKNK